MLASLTKSFWGRVHSFSSYTKPKSVAIEIDEYPINVEPRYGHGKPPHPQIYELINRNRIHYATLLAEFLSYKESILAIDSNGSSDSQRPCWVNDYYSSLDGVSLYGLIRKYHPKNYIEIGSGYSTKFARRAVADGRLQTKMISIDPFARSNIDGVSDQIIRQPLESIDLSLFDRLGENDICFFDGSHRCFMNSDVTVFFLEVLPRLRKGVLIHIHDIFLPYDYPPQWAERYYSEQYLLACYLLARDSGFKILLPNKFISLDKPLLGILKPLLDDPKFQEIGIQGVAFWMVKQ